MRKLTIENSQLRIIILVSFFILSIVHFQFSIPVYASENDIGYSKINPASPFYFLKTIREDLELKFAGTLRVTQLRHLEFATRRLREVRTIVSIKPDLIPPTLEKYIAQLNAIPEREIQDMEVSTRIKDSLVIHLEVLQQIYDQASNLRAKMAIRLTMNRIILRTDVPNYAKLPVCTFFAKEASSSALNQTEQFVLKQRAEKCFAEVKS